ncbi:hypothetical protein ACCO45_011216 [Purpureocillium lilacinum]|uniref:Uncharacterized protein n=1 Tax=Purpureocillium lilacinum TaxID=33203 RepID=A0ACC4DHY2_PURLI
MGFGTGGGGAGGVEVADKPRGRWMMDDDWAREQQHGTSGSVGNTTDQVGDGSLLARSTAVTSCLAVRPPVHPAERATGVTDWTLPSVAQSPSPLLRVTPSLLLPLALRATDLKQQQELQQREQTKAAGAIRRHETRPERPLPPHALGPLLRPTANPPWLASAGFTARRHRRPVGWREDERWRRRRPALQLDPTLGGPDSSPSCSRIPHAAGPRPPSGRPLAVPLARRRSCLSPPPVISALVSGPRRS